MLNRHLLALAHSDLVSMLLQLPGQATLNYRLHKQETQEYCPWHNRAHTRLYLVLRFLLGEYLFGNVEVTSAAAPHSC